MSYCVNCGVELDASLKSCPLCNTPVINPNELQKLSAQSPFPEEKGQVETVRRKDIAVLLTTFLLSTSIACALLNALTYHRTLWSLPVIGICLLIWVFCIPLVILRKLPPALSVLFDGAATIVYLYLLTHLTNESLWFSRIGIPIVALVTVIVEAMVFFCRKFSVSFLGFFLCLVIATAFLCIGIEIILDLYLHEAVTLGWSAVVLTACTIMTVVLATILSKKRLRSALRRRLHF